MKRVAAVPLREERQSEEGTRGGRSTAMPLVVEAGRACDDDTFVYALSTLVEVCALDNLFLLFLTRLVEPS